MGTFHLHTDLIVGLPYEDLASLANSFDEIIALRADHFQMGFLKVLPGTKMADLIAEYGIKHTTAPPYEILANRWLSFDQINHLKQVEQLLDKYYGSRKYVFAIDYCFQLWKSPFAFFGQLSAWFSQQGHDIRIKDWVKNSKFLLDFLRQKYPDQVTLFIDLLRYDWCNNFSGKIPVVLDSSTNQAMRQTAQEYLKQYNYSGIIKFAGEQFSMKQLKNANYFRAESANFYQLLQLPQQELIMFVDQQPFISWQADF